MDSDASTIQMGFRAAYGWSEYLWKGVFAKLPAAKAAKTEGATDFKVVVHALLAGGCCCCNSGRCCYTACDCIAGSSDQHYHFQ